MPTVIAILFVSVVLIGQSAEGDFNKYADDEQDSSSEQWLLPDINQSTSVVIIG